MKKNIYFIKSTILNYINKKNYYLAIKTIKNLQLNSKKNGIYTYILSLLLFLENPYELPSTSTYHYEAHENLYKHFYEALKNKDYLEAYLTILNEDYSNDMDKKIIKALLQQIYEANRFKSSNLDIIINNILEFGLTKEDIVLLKNTLQGKNLNVFENNILDILSMQDILNQTGESLHDLTKILDIYSDNHSYQNYNLAMQYGDYLTALELLDTNFYQKSSNQKQIRQYEFIKLLLTNLLSEEEIKSQEQLKKEKLALKKTKKLNNLDKYVSSEYFVRALRYYKKQKKFFDKDNELEFETFIQLGISCLKYEYQVLKKETVKLYQKNQFTRVIDNLNELKNISKKLELNLDMNYAYKLISARQQLFKNKDASQINKKYEEAKTAYLNHDYYLSLTLIDECLNYSYSQFWLLKGKILVKLHQYDNAKKSFLKAIRECDEPYSFIHLGLLEAKTGHYEEALNNFFNAYNRTDNRDYILKKISQLQEFIEEKTLKNKCLEIIKKP